MHCADYLCNKPTSVPCMLNVLVHILFLPIWMEHASQNEEGINENTLVDFGMHNTAVGYFILSNCQNRYLSLGCKIWPWKRTCL